jgi:SulP family sulfate permease
MNAKKLIDFHPKFIDAMKNYSRDKFTADVMAGIIVGIVAIPLAIAFGIASGVGPAEGLVTAILAGFLISVLGGSKVQIGGPTGAFIIIIYGVIQQYGLGGLAIATIMAGIILVIMGLCRLGTIIKFMPYPIIIGFTGGIAITIFSTQINDLFGLGISNVPANFIDKWV